MSEEEKIERQDCEATTDADCGAGLVSRWDEDEDEDEELHA